MLIKVERKHIDQGESRSARTCMVALAIHDATGVEVAVTKSQVRCGIERKYPLPDHVQDAIDRFDDGQDVEPFEFEMELEATK
jgi:hypothetical protein